jgi:histidinol-phosphate aminotransferase
MDTRNDRSGSIAGSSAIAGLIRPDVLEMEPYAPIQPYEVVAARLGRTPGELIKLDANENPYGPSPRALRALASLQYAHIYPDPESIALRTALAADTGLPTENLLAGAGADELIDLIMRLFLQPGDAILNCPPTFGMYAFDAGLHGSRVVNVPRKADFSVDVAALEFQVAASRPGTLKLLFLASPNNPDGRVMPDQDLRRLLRLPIAVVLDEAYIEFHGPSRLDWVLQHNNLIVLRTFSKRGGLAGLRVGYGAFPAELMPHLWKIKQPYNVSVAASAAAIAALSDHEHMTAVVERIVAERERLLACLAEFGYLSPYSSRANFILCRVVGRNAARLKLALEARGILVRYFNKPGLEDCIRISVGRPEDNDALLCALRELS